VKASEYRSRIWPLNKITTIDDIQTSISEWIEQLVSDVIEDYIQSDQFVEDASDYCRDQGWKEPN